MWSLSKVSASLCLCTPLPSSGLPHAYCATKLPGYRRIYWCSTRRSTSSPRDCTVQHPKGCDYFEWWPVWWVYCERPLHRITEKIPLCEPNLIFVISCHLILNSTHIIHAHRWYNKHHSSDRIMSCPPQVWENDVSIYPSPHPEVWLRSDLNKIRLAWKHMHLIIVYTFRYRPFQVCG